MFAQYPFPKYLLVQSYRLSPSTFISVENCAQEKLLECSGTGAFTLDPPLFCRIRSNDRNSMRLEARSSPRVVRSAEIQLKSLEQLSICMSHEIRTGHRSSRGYIEIEKRNQSDCLCQSALFPLHTHRC